MLASLASAAEENEARGWALAGRRFIDTYSGLPAFRFSTYQNYQNDPQRRVAFFKRFAIYIPFGLKFETIHVYDLATGVRR